MATKTQRFKAQEIEQSIKTRQNATKQQIDKLDQEVKQLEAEVTKKKRLAWAKQIQSAGKNKDLMERADELREAVKLGSEVVDLKHKAKDIQKIARKKEQDTKFELKQMQKEANKLKV